MYVKGRYSHVYIIRQFCYQLLLLSYKGSTKNILHFWYIIWTKINIKVFSSANGKGQVNYCHHFASVIFVGLRRELFTFVPTFLKLNYRTKAWRNGSLVVDPLSELCPIGPLSFQYTTNRRIYFRNYLWNHWIGFN